MLDTLIESSVRTFVLGTLAWLLLKALRVRNPHMAMLTWRVVLATALLMPLLMYWNAVQVPVESVVLLQIAAGINASTTAMASGTSWHTLALLAYLAITGCLFLNYLRNLAAGWMIWRRAKTLSVAWTDGMKVGVSTAISTPVTFASTILLPPDYLQWSALKRRAVLAHEQAHVRNRDFYVQTLAHLHRIVFWFNPFAWWLSHQLAAVSEDISDNAAIAALEDRASYAEVLLEVASQHRHAAGAIAMAKPAGVCQRVERILSEDHCPARPNTARRATLGLFLLPVIFFAACTPMQPKIDPPTANLSKMEKPPYPAEARSLGQEGVVVLQLYVEKDGDITDAKIEKSSGFPELDEAARQQAVDHWTLNPGKKNGKPTAMWHTFKVKFALDN